MWLLLFDLTAVLRVGNVSSWTEKMESFLNISKRMSEVRFTIGLMLKPAQKEKYQANVCTGW